MPESVQYVRYQFPVVAAIPGGGLGAVVRGVRSFFRGGDDAVQAVSHTRPRNTRPAARPGAGRGGTGRTTRPAGGGSSSRTTTGRPSGGGGGHVQAPSAARTGTQGNQPRYTRLNSTPDTGEVDLSIFHNMRYGRAAPQLAQLAKTGNYSIERLNAAEIASRSHVNPVWYSADAIMGGVLSTVAFLPGVMDYFGKGTTAMVEEQMKSDAAWKDEQQAYMEQYAIQNLGLSPTTAHNIAVSDRQQIANQAYLDAWQRGTGPVWNEMVAAGTADPAYSAAPPTGY